MSHSLGARQKDLPSRRTPDTKKVKTHLKFAISGGYPATRTCEYILVSDLTELLHPPPPLPTPAPRGLFTLQKRDAAVAHRQMQLRMKLKSTGVNVQIE